VVVTGWSFSAYEPVRLLFIDFTNGTKKLTTVETDAKGAFTTQVSIPADATLGKQQIKASGKYSGQSRKRSFTVT
jgi:hypothetical protein